MIDGTKGWMDVDEECRTRDGRLLMWSLGTRNGPERKASPANDEGRQAAK